MNKVKSDLPKIVSDNEIYNLFESKWQNLAIDWTELLLKWLHGSYRNFNDHEKYLILIFIVKKTFDKYSENFLPLNYNQFYSFNEIEIEKINIVEISKELNISRETTRRKISELEKLGIIKKNNKKLIVKKETYNIQKPKEILKLISAFLSKFSHVARDEKLINKEFSKEKAESILLLNFSYTWKLWLEMLMME